jgi:hypothetical protein
MVIGPALDTVSVIQDHSERAAVDKHRKKLRDHYAAVALQQRDSLVNAGEQHVRTWIAEVEQALSDLVHPGAGVGAAREAALAEIGGLRDEVKKLIEQAAG